VKRSEIDEACFLIESSSSNDDQSIKLFSLLITTTHLGKDCIERLRVSHQKRRDLARVLKMEAAPFRLAQGSDHFGKRIAVVSVGNDRDRWSFMQSGGSSGKS